MHFGLGKPAIALTDWVQHRTMQAAPIVWAMDFSHMPLTLTKYLLGEMLRAMLLATVVLVTVIAFGAAIKPLANESLLGAGQAIKYIALATIPMLQFALPFAAGFASTMVLHRFVNDNEVIAMRAGGISARQMLMPVAALGLVLVAIMLLLTQAIIPHFWQMMRNTITADVTRQFQVAIEGGRPFEVDDLQIFADQLWVDDNPVNTQADTRLWLERVVAAETDSDGRVTSEVTAGQATVDIYRRDGATFIKLRMIDTVRYDALSGELVAIPDVAPSQPIVVPNVFDDDPVFLSRAGLKRLKRNMDLSRNEIDRYRIDLARAMQTDEFLREIDGRLKRDGMVTLVGNAAGVTRTYELHAAEIDGASVANGDEESILVRQMQHGRVIQEFRATEIELAPTGGSPRAWLEDPRLDMLLRDYVVTDDSDVIANRRAALPLQSLAVQGFNPEILPSLNSEELLQRRREMEKPSREILIAGKTLQRRRANLGYEIDARLQKRYALSVTAFLLLLLGAALAMLLRNSLPLTTYLWAVIPSIGDLVIISGGEQMMRDGRTLGVIVLWSGNVLLLIGILTVLRKLMRH